MPDNLNKTVTFLAKRDGIDKTLKIIRYTSRLVLAGTSVQASLPEVGTKLSSLESSIATARKALKLGKFLQAVQDVQDIKLGSENATLEFVAVVSDGAYLFCEQLQWLIKTGVMGKQHAGQISTFSSWCELISYMASIMLRLRKQKASLELELQVMAEMGLAAQADPKKWSAEKQAAYRTKLAKIRNGRKMQTLGMIQDLADTFLALGDLRDNSKMLQNPVLRAAAGLLSGAVSGYAKWPGVKL